MKYLLTILLFLSLAAHAQSINPLRMWYWQQAGIPKVDTSTYQDADAQKFIDSAVITDATQKAAIYRFVADLKGIPNALYYTVNMWDKFKAIYPFVGGTAAAHKWNLKSPYDQDTSFRLTFNGTITHSATGIGFTVAAYAQSHLVPSTTLTLGNAHMAMYSQTATSSGSGTVDMGAQSGANSADITYMRMGVYRTGNVAFGLISGSSTVFGVSVNNFNGKGCYIISDFTTNTHIYYRNAVALTVTGNNTSPFTPTALPNVELIINGMNSNVTGGTTGISAGDNKTFSFASIGAGLTKAECIALNNAIQQYQTTLGRAVN